MNSRTPLHTCKPVIGITLGDYNGIGPEVALKSVSYPRVREACIPILIGPVEIYMLIQKQLKMNLKFVEGKLPDTNQDRCIGYISPVRGKSFPIRPGMFTRRSGELAGECLSVAASLCSDGWMDGIVTAPVSKEALNLAGYRFPGQTEMLARLTGSSRAVMMFIDGDSRVALATRHLPVRDISRAITKKSLLGTLTTIVESLKQDFGISSPQIAILGLNPHAGENGMIGSEEHDVIIPVIKCFRNIGTRIHGPFPADGYWGSGQHRAMDLTLAMYHDQGLIPFKMQHFSKGVNYTAGMPIVRTSPDHGTAFDIAGTNSADPRSMVESILLATKIVSRRKP